jgi:IS605 OrfB family transposase
MWNFLVERFDNTYPRVSKFGLRDYKPRQLLNDIGFGSLIPQRVAASVLKKYSESWQRFYDRRKYPHMDIRPPKRHYYDPQRQSFCISSRDFEITDGQIQCPCLKSSYPGKLITGKIPINTKFLDKYNVTTITEPRFTCEHGKWYISGSYELPDVEKRTDVSNIGLDWGEKNFYTDSNGERINYPNKVIRQFYRINRLKSIRDTKVKYSRNWRKLNKKVALAYQRLEGIKRNFIEQITTELMRNSNVAIEDLTGSRERMQEGMSRRKKRQKNRLMVLAPRFRFEERLEQKATKYGTVFIKVNPAYTSMTCSGCGHINYDLTLKQRIYDCPVCGLVLDRGHNAAINIAARGFC